MLKVSSHYILLLNLVLFIAENNILMHKLYKYFKGWVIGLCKQVSPVFMRHG